jgi:hypothetical protein
MESISEKRAGSGKKYERFGELIRYLNQDELSQFFDGIDNYRHNTNCDYLMR